jgi:hypothetical protein
VRALFGLGTSAVEPQTQGGVGMTEEELDVCQGEAEIGGQEHAPDRPGGGVEAIEGRAPVAGKAFARGVSSELLNTVRTAIAEASPAGNLMRERLGSRGR